MMSLPFWPVNIPYGLKCLQASAWLVLLLCPAIAANSVDVRKVDAHLKEHVARDFSRGILVAWIESSGQVWMRTAGVVAAHSAEAPGPDTLFEIGPLTQVLTVAAASALVENRQLSWDTPVWSLLPAHVISPESPGAALRLKHLATHTSGLPLLPPNLGSEDVQDPYSGYGEESLYTFLKAFGVVPMPDSPGAFHRFSPLGIGILGHLMERRTQLDLSAVIKREITSPLGLSDTVIDLSSEQALRLASGYEGQTQAPQWTFDVLSGYGAYRSTARNLLSLLKAHLEPPAQGPLNKAFRTLRNRVLITDTRDTWCGFGWNITVAQGRDLHWQSGSTGGYSAFAGMDYGQMRAVVVLSNSSLSVDRIGFHLLAPDQWPLEHPFPEMHSNEPLAAAVAGVYESPSGVKIRIRNEASKIYIQVDDNPEYRLYPIKAGLFRYAKGETQVEFPTLQGVGSREAGKPASHLIIRHKLNRMPARRIP